MKKLSGILCLWILGITTVWAAPTKSEPLNALYQPAGNAVAGNPKGHITLVEFFDYNCGYCRLIYPKLLKLVATHRDVRVIFREYPVLSEKSVLPVQAALAAQRQGKYAALHTAMMKAMMPLDQSEIDRLAKPLDIDIARLKKDMQEPAIKAQIKQNLDLGQSLNIQGVPAFIVARTTPPSTQQPQIIVGASIPELKKLIEQAEKHHA